MNPGLGVMLHYLFGDGDGGEHVKAAIGKTIERVVISDRVATLHFNDETWVAFKDKGQSCCEDRFMVCDDDLTKFKGAKFVDAKIKDGPTVKGEYDEPKECQFLELVTDRGAISVANYNEHNGYYGGFAIVAEGEVSL